MQILGPLKSRVTNLAFTPDGWGLMSAGPYSPSIRIWELTNNTLRRFLKPTDDRGAVASVVLSPAGDRLFVSYSLTTNQQSPVMWDAWTGTPVPWQHATNLGEVHFEPTGRRFLSVSGSSQPPPNPQQLVRVYASDSGEALFDRPGIPATIQSTETVLDFRDGGLLTYRSGQLVRYTPDGETTVALNGTFVPTNPWAVSPCGAYLANTRWTTKRLIYRIGELQVWDTTDGRLMWEATELPWVIEAVAFSPDGSQVATADGRGGVTLWATASGARLASYDFDIGRVYTVAFAPDGNRAAVGGKDRIVIWDLN